MKKPKNVLNKISQGILLIHFGNSISLIKQKKLILHINIQSDAAEVETTEELEMLEGTLRGKTGLFPAKCVTEAVCLKEKN